MIKNNRYRKNDDVGFVRVLRCLFFLLFLIFPGYLCAQLSTRWEELRAEETGKSPYVSRIIEYKPAPGQFINEAGIGTPEAAESIVGGINGLVSLGGFGGYITVGFDHTLLNDPGNPYGVDFTVVGNAAGNSSEPGIVMVMADTNGNGLADDTWYELKGSNHGLNTTIWPYTLTYINPGTENAADIPWKDSRGNSGVLKAVTAHTQPYYPSSGLFPGYPRDQVSFTGTLIGLDMDDENPQYIRISALPYGYADNYPFRGNPPYLPDDPHTTEVLEGNGGNAFDIDWAVDENGDPVHLEGIDFIRIYTAVNANAGWLGEISTEVCGIIDVSPDDVTWVSPPDKKRDILVYPNPATQFIKIECPTDVWINRVEIWNASGRLLFVNPQVNQQSLTVSVQDFPPGIYLVRIDSGNYKETRKIIVVSGD